MFETSVVRVRAAAAPRRFGLLTASIAIHSLAVVAAVVMTVSSVGFPAKAPDEADIFRPFPAVSLPPALGTPKPVGKPAAAPAQPVSKPAPAAAVTAPAVVPDTVTPAASSSAGDANVSAATGDPGEGTSGSPLGVPGGIGDVDTSIGPATGEVLVPGGEVKSAVVLQRVEPVYPRVAIAGRISGTVLVRCIIGKGGTCRNPQIVMSTFGAFNQPAIDAVTKWRFAPGTYRGQVVDTYFELTVRFNVK